MIGWTDAELCRRVLTVLDLALVKVEPPSLKVCQANPAGRDLLALWGAAVGGPLPPPLASLFPASSEIVERSFTPAVEVLAPGRISVFVRWRKIAGTPPIWIMTLSRAKRTQDLAKVLSDKFQMSRREAQVALLLSAGLRNNEIARDLRIKTGTVRWYVGRILTATDVRHRGELTALIQRLRDSSD